jgi:endonuclease/exonuclease/phosphatase family metal-dependent hydrolase
VLSARPASHRPWLAGVAALALLLTGGLAGCSTGSGRATAGKGVTAPSATLTETPESSSPATNGPVQRVVPPGPPLAPKRPHANGKKAGPGKSAGHHGRTHGKKTRHHRGAPAIPLVSDPFTVASFNTLGAVHTARGGNKPGMPAASVRTLRMIEVLRKHQVDVVGLQEFESPQANLFKHRAGATYAYWHPAGKSANAIAWRRDRFALVGTLTQPVHYFGGKIQPMPGVLLEDLHNPAFKFWVLNVHNPASTRWHPGNQRWRNIDMVKEHALAQRLVAGGTPVLFTGDMNEKASAFCAFTRDGVLQAAQGGSHENGQCRPPSTRKIDWIFGSHHVLFNDFRVDRSPLVRKTTDHSVVLTEAQLLSSGS